MRFRDQARNPTQPRGFSSVNRRVSLVGRRVTGVGIRADQVSLSREKCRLFIIKRQGRDSSRPALPAGPVPRPCRSPLPLAPRLQLAAVPYTFSGCLCSMSAFLPAVAIWSGADFYGFVGKSAAPSLIGSRPGSLTRVAGTHASPLERPRGVGRGRIHYTAPPRAFPGKAARGAMLRVAATHCSKLQAGGELQTPPALLTIVSGGKAQGGMDADRSAPEPFHGVRPRPRSSGSTSSAAVGPRLASRG